MLKDCITISVFLKVLKSNQLATFVRALRDLTFFNCLISWRKLNEKLLAGFYGNINSKNPS